ncbi:MAG: DUF2029 domain-containing protein [Planctomycetes bacterium]|nr:DUF2029 domain-containing protein [Planctomycetota bacterium]
MLAAAVGLASGSGWAADLARPERHVESDFEILYAAGSALRAGDDPHDPAVLDAQGARLGRAATPFSAAPPLVTAVFAQLSRLDFERAYDLWLGFGGACVLATALLLADALRRAGLPTPAALAAGCAFVLLNDALWMSLAMNSTNALTLAALALAACAGCRGRTTLEGVALAVAIVAKTSPALLLVPLALGGRLRTVRAASLALVVLGGVSLLVAGPAVHRSWVEHVLPALGYAPELPAGAFDNGLHAWNLAPHGVLARAAVEADLPRVAVQIGAWCVSALVLAQLVLAVRALRRGAGQPRDDASRGSVAPTGPDARRAREVLRLYGLGVAASFLVSSVTWPHHLVFAALPAASLLADLHLACVPRRVGATTHGTRDIAPVVPAPDVLRPLVGLLAWIALALPLGLLPADGTQPPAILLETAACIVLFAAVGSTRTVSGGG